MNIDYLCCSICLEIFQNPVQLRCSHTFCEPCLNKSLKVKSVCSLCRSPVKESEIQPNRLVANIIQEYQKSVAEKGLSNDSSKSQGKLLRLTITENYAPNWKTRQGVREITQNWFDGLNERILLDHKDDFLLPKLKITVSTSADGSLTFYTGTILDFPLGQIVHDSKNSTLRFVNEQTTLQRKILLLGSTTKFGKDEFVGKFGEGLKLGILALLRDKKGVKMTTNGEDWTFQLTRDEDFGGTQNVLGVFVEPSLKRDLKIRECTETMLFGISTEEWNILVKDFLFLSIPKDMCETPSGSLIIDAEYRHKLYVKEFWIADMQEDGLFFGVDLNHMELDRDRRAVVKKHDIDKKVADVWTNAVLVRRDLIPVYYDLLMQDHTMMHNAFMYITDLGVSLLEEHFFRTEGENAIPVLNTDKDSLLIIEQNLGKKAVLCPETFYNILSKSPKIQPITALHNQFIMNTNNIVPLSSLSMDQYQTLTSAIATFTDLVDPNFDIAMVDILPFSFHTGSSTLLNSIEENARFHSNRLQLSKHLLDIDFVHKNNCRCSSLASGPSSSRVVCKCRETMILLSIIEAKAKAKSSNNNYMQKGFEKLMVERLLEKLLEKTL